MVNGMNHQMIGKTMAVDFHGDGLQQERHVFDDYFDNGMLRLPAMFFQRWVVDAYFFRTRLVAERHVPMGKHRAIQIFEHSFLKIVQGHELKIMSGEFHQPSGLLRRQALLNELRQMFQNLVDVVIFHEVNLAMVMALQNSAL